jgi:hypothetical protein
MQHKVLKAVEELSAAEPAGELFRRWHSVQAIAAKAGVSESSVRKHLPVRLLPRGFAAHRFAGGAIGYRFYGER